jgi:UDP-glucose 4-epimerase
MRVLVTGSAGRLGRSVVSVLRDEGHDVIGVDRVAAASTLVVDLADRSATRRLIREQRPEAVVHLAAIAVPFSAPEHEIFTVNTTMAFAVIEAALDVGATRILVASSPTVYGYGSPDFAVADLPFDEDSPVRPSNAYSLSKVCVEYTVDAFAARHPGARIAAFRPCYVIAPEEWAGIPTQQGHTVLERLTDPALAAVSLFNYLDARDAGAFVAAWLGADDAPSGARYIIGAADALASSPLAELLPRFHPGLAAAAAALSGTSPAFDVSRARRDTGWQPTRSWRTELPVAELARLASHAPPVEPARTVSTAAPEPTSDRTFS